MTTTIKTLDVTAKEWFDRVNGNSYFSGRITVNYGMEDERTIFIPFQYGYGDHYKHMAFSQLQKAGLLPETDDRTIFWRYYEEKGIIARHTKYEKCLKREVTAFATA